MRYGYMLINQLDNNYYSNQYDRSYGDASSAAMDVPLIVPYCRSLAAVSTRLPGVVLLRSFDRETVATANMLEKIAIRGSFDVHAAAVAQIRAARRELGLDEHRAGFSHYS
ncbi:MAG: hypothetical protein GY788_17630 [bacterium]|nr:hypothetical protein [bacterium]